MSLKNPAARGRLKTEDLSGMSTIQPWSGNSQELADSVRSRKQQKEELQESHDREIENLKRSHAAEKAALEDRFEAGSQAERLAHYENLRRLKNQITREEQDLESRGKEEISRKDAALRAEERSVEKEGLARVEDTRRKFAALGEYERQRMNSTGKEIREDHAKNTKLLMQESENALESLRENKEKFLADRRRVHEESLTAIEGHFNSMRSQKTDQLETDLKTLDDSTRRELHKKIVAASGALTRFETEKQDPFYQLQRFDSALSETPDAFVLRVKVPEHERKNLRVQGSGKDFQLIGVRTSEREVQENGKTLSTRSHQTISEKIALNAPIDPKGILREDAADYVQFTLPKSGSGRVSKV